MRYTSNCESTILDPVSQPAVWIVGASKLQNELTAWFLNRTLDARCFIVGNLWDISTSGCWGGENRDKLVLLDCEEKEWKSLLVELRAWGHDDKSSQYRIALFNVTRNAGSEGISVRLGVRGVFYEHDSLDQFLKGVKAILEGEWWLSRKVLMSCIMEAEEKNRFLDTRTPKLSRRQVDILCMLASGSTNHEIADKLCISINTVKTHLYTIFKKINVDNRLQAALWTANNVL